MVLRIEINYQAINYKVMKIVSCIYDLPVQNPPYQQSDIITIIYLNLQFINYQPYPLLRNQYQEPISSIFQATKSKYHVTYEVIWICIVTMLSRKPDIQPPII